MALLGGLGSGQSLGFAQGRIGIDTSDLNRVVGHVRQVSAQVEQGFSRIGGAARRVQTRLASVVVPLRAILGSFGIMFGVAAISQVTRFGIAIKVLTTSYQRQRIAAVDLAGSQAKLNSLMGTYDRATGGVVDKATALADVTRLLSVGFANTSEDLERFVTAARGASIALGVSQEYIISQLQLAIVNQSEMRLDQLGLGVAEVNRRIKELRENTKGLTDELAFEQAIIGLLIEKYGGLVTSSKAQATVVETASRAWKDLRLEFGLLIDEPVGGFLKGVTEDLQTLNDTLDNLEGPLGRVGRAFRQLSENAASFRNIGVDQMRYQLQRDERLEARTGIGAFVRRGVPLGIRTGIGVNLRPEGQLPPAVPPTPPRMELVQKWADDVENIERQANQQRLDETQDYEQQRTETISKYEQTIAQEAEDFARQRTRSQQQFSQQLLRARETILDRDSQSQLDYADLVVELRENSNERLADLEESYARDRLQAREDYQDNLASAAARLDAFAVFEEQRRYARGQKVADENFQEQISDEKSNLQERLTDEEEAFDKRSALSRKNDRDRLETLQETFDDQIRLGDEDRRIRLDRQAADYTAQLDEIDIQHGLRLAQIDRQSAEERVQLDQAFQEALQNEGTATQAFITQQDLRRNAALRIFNEWWDGITGVIREATAGLSRPSGGDPSTFQQFASGGPVNRTGLALVHAGEYVMTPQMMQSSRRISINAPIQIMAAPGQSEIAIGEAVRNELTGLLRAWA